VIPEVFALNDVESLVMQLNGMALPRSRAGAKARPTAPRDCGFWLKMRGFWGSRERPWVAKHSISSNALRQVTNIQLARGVASGYRFATSGAQEAPGWGSLVCQRGCDLRARPRICSV